MSGLNVSKIMEGCFTATAGDESVLLGCPSEVLKVFFKNKIPLPKTIVLPADFYRQGTIQADLEFPLYYFLFVYGGFFKGEKMKIVGTTGQLMRMKKILKLTLLGPSGELMKEWGIPEEVILDQVRISNQLALKKKSGEIAQIDDMVEFVAFNSSGVANTGNVTVEVNNKNIFTVSIDHETTVVDLNFFNRQSPPIPIELSATQIKRSAFGMTALSKCTTGFDPTGYTSGLLLWVNSMAILVDGIAWTKDHLRALGISTHEIQGHILTHIHGDHSSMVELIINGQKVNLITTKEIYESFMVKVSLLLGWGKARIKEMVNFIEIVPGVPFSWFGAKLNFFRTVHPISTIGFEISMGEKKIIYSGDTLWGEKLKMLAFDSEKFISAKMYHQVQQIPERDADVIIMDSGGGLIHSDPKELNLLPEMKKRRIYMTHLPKYPEGVSGLNMIIPGQHWELIKSKKISIGDINNIYNAPIFAGIDRRWLNAILSQGNIESAPLGRVVLKAGLPGKDFYLVLSGTFSVISKDGEEIAKLSSGDFFGEISLMQKIPCTATVQASSDGRMLAIPEDVFMAIIQQTHLGEKLRKIHRIRPVLFNCGWIKELPPNVVNEISGRAEERHYKSGEYIVVQGEVGSELFFIQDGRVRIQILANGLEAREVANLFPGQFFGEMALLPGNGKRTATVIADKDTKVLVLKKQDFNDLTGEVPVLLYTLGVMAEDRGKELSE